MRIKAKEEEAAEAEKARIKAQEEAAAAAAEVERANAAKKAANAAEKAAAEAALAAAKVEQELAAERQRQAVEAAAAAEAAVVAEAAAAEKRQREAVEAAAVAEAAAAAEAAATEKRQKILRGIQESIDKIAAAQQSPKNPQEIANIASNLAEQLSVLSIANIPITNIPNAFNKDNIGVLALNKIVSGYNTKLFSGTNNSEQIKINKEEFIKNVIPKLRSVKETVERLRDNITNKIRKKETSLKKVHKSKDVKKYLDKYKLQMSKSLNKYNAQIKFITESIAEFEDSKENYVEIGRDTFNKLNKYIALFSSKELNDEETLKMLDSIHDIIDKMGKVKDSSTIERLEEIVEELQNKQILNIIYNILNNFINVRTDDNDKIKIEVTIKKALDSLTPRTHLTAKLINDLIFWIMEDNSISKEGKLNIIKLYERAINNPNIFKPAFKEPITNFTNKLKSWLNESNDDEKDRIKTELDKTKQDYTEYLEHFQRTVDKAVAAQKALAAQKAEMLSQSRSTWMPPGAAPIILSPKKLEPPLVVEDVVTEPVAVPVVEPVREESGIVGNLSQDSGIRSAHSIQKEREEKAAEKRKKEANNTIFKKLRNNTVKAAAAAAANKEKVRTEKAEEAEANARREAKSQLIRNSMKKQPKQAENEYSNFGKLPSTPVKVSDEEMKNTIQKLVNGIESYEDKLGQIELQKAIHSDNILIQNFLSKLEEEIKEIKETQQSKVVETAPINSINNQIERAKELADEAERNMKAARITQQQTMKAYTNVNNPNHNSHKIAFNTARTNLTEKTSKYEKLIRNVWSLKAKQQQRGGKKTSKKHPIRRTFRKKDKKSKKKNVSRKKHHK